MVRPKSAYDNLERLKNYKMLGQYGFYEAIDFTPRRNFNVANNEPYSVVKSYMVHHQGMSLLALNNVINDNIMQERFHSLPLVKSANLLLQEKVAKDVIYTKDNKEVSFDPEARLNSEFNFVSAKRTSNKTSYIIEYSDTVIKFIVGGYYFELNNLSDYKSDLIDQTIGITLRSIDLATDINIDGKRSTTVLDS
jgi:hypothetical protein